MSNSTSTAAIAQRIETIRATLPPRVRLIAVTKQVPVDSIRAAYEAGVRDFGESRIQEAIPKQDRLQDLQDITWHFIGHLQGNKAQRAVERFQWIHSLDSLKLAQRLDRLATDLENPPQFCLQVKPLPDPSKYGWTIPELWDNLSALERLTHLSIAGLMTILPEGLASTEIQQAFQMIRDLASQINERSGSPIRIQQLSMGMSADYPLAIESGATMIRLGRILFGDRSV